MMTTCLTTAPAADPYPDDGFLTEQFLLAYPLMPAPVRRAVVAAVLPHVPRDWLADRRVMEAAGEVGPLTEVDVVVMWADDCGPLPRADRLAICDMLRPHLPAVALADLG